LGITWSVGTVTPAGISEATNRVALFEVIVIPPAQQGRSDLRVWGIHLWV
jgi:hypothetical protein